jgi:hypothetical protein
MNAGRAKRAGRWFGVLACVVFAAWSHAAGEGVLAGRSTAGDATAPAEATLWVWVDGRTLGPARDAAAEAAVIAQTAAGVVELFGPIDDANRAALAAAGSAISRREAVLVSVRFEDGRTRIEASTTAGRPEATAAARGDERPVASLAAHRAWADSAAPDLPPAFEVWIDVNALRGRFADTLEDDRLPGLLRAAGLANARSVMLHGRWVAPEGVALADPSLPLPRSSLRLGEYTGPPLLRIDVSWNSRADDLRTIRGTNIAAGHWPAAALREPAASATSVVVIRWPWFVRLERVLEARAAWLARGERERFADRVRSWRQESRSRLDRACGSLHGWLLIGLDASVPGLLRIEARTRDDGAAPANIAADVAHLLGPLGADVRAARGIWTYAWSPGRPLADLTWAAAEGGPAKGLVGAATLAGCRADAAADVRRRATK